MRKIITSSVLILLFSLFSGSVFAGKIEACENIKHDPAYKGLYGLCNAYWNADENAQDKILAKFEKKAGPGGPGMPGLESAVCPCWTAEELATATFEKDGAFCSSFAGMDEAVYVGNVPFFSAMILDPLTGAGVCEFNIGIAAGYELTDADELAVCRAGIQVLQDSQHEDGAYVFPPCFEG